MSTTAPQLIPTGTYNIDPAHSNVGFEVKHMAIATVRGSFKTFDGTINAVDGLSAAGTIDVASIDTGTQGRDDDLRSENFFDVAKFPQITFKTTSVSVSADHKLSVGGELTIKGVTRPIQLTGEVGESAEDPWGHERVGFELQGTIDRRDFDLRRNQTLTNGNLLIGNNIKLIIGISAVRAD